MKNQKDRDADSLAAFAHRFAEHGGERGARAVARTSGLTWKAVNKRLKKLRRDEQLRARLTRPMSLVELAKAAKR